MAPKTPFIDHYAVLEIQFGASAVEIRRAWMQLVKQWQSKANSGDLVATEHLQQIHEAYTVLSDPREREEYDTEYLEVKQPFIDFYAILEIPTNASSSDIRQAYRKQEFWWRPDRNLNDPDAPLRYKLIQLAYKVLNDLDARGRYDRDYFWKKRESQQHEDAERQRKQAEQQAREQEELLKRESEKLQQEIDRQRREAEEKRQHEQQERERRQEERLKRESERLQQEIEKQRRETERKQRRERRKHEHEQAEKAKQQRENETQAQKRERQRARHQARGASNATTDTGAFGCLIVIVVVGLILWGAWTLGTRAWQAIFSTDEPPVVVTVQPTATYTPIPTATYTPQPPSPTPSPIPTSSPVPTDTPIPTAIPTSTPLPTDTPTFTPTPTYTLTPSPVPTDTPTPTPPPADTPVPTPTLTPTPEPTDSAIHSHLTIATPDCDSSGINSAYLHDLKVGVRELINNARAAEGVPILFLAGSGVSQCHAEDMANNCFTSHWSTNGTKPHVRYATAGYENRVIEIIDGHNYCTQDVDTTDIATRIRDTATRLLDDPEHRQKLVDASNVSLDIGIAADEHRNLWLVIGLASDFIEFEEPPHIDNFEISMHGKIENGARISSTEGLWIEIYYDPLPVQLTRGQLARTTSCVELGEMEARLLRPGPNYIQRSFIVDKPACLNPYQSASGIAPPGSIQGAAELSDHMDIQAANLVSRRHAGLLIVASEWQVSENQDFSVTADLEEVLKRHGNGIYTAAIYALLNDESQIVAEYPMFVTGMPTR